MTDPIADMLTRIRNAQAVQKETVEVPFSRLKYEIAEVMARHGFLKAVGIRGKKARRVLEINLKYDQDKAPAIAGLKRVSKPGQRIYVAARGLRKVKDGTGIAILSTSKGILGDQEGRKAHMGGEVLCEVW